VTTLYLANIADAISSISISGVTVKDKDQVSASWLAQPNVLFPNVENWIDNFTLAYNILDGVETVSYTLNYRFLSTQIGDLATFPVAFSDLVDKVSTILGALVDVLSPYSDNVTMKVTSVQIGGRTDPVGNEYHGADISLAIEESH
jgi:hypothetical protein